MPSACAVPACAHLLCRDLLCCAVTCCDALCRARCACCAVQDVSSTEAAIIYTLEPVFGAAFAYYLLGERWGMSGWVGAALIVTSCLAAQLLGVEEEHHHAMAAESKV